MKPERWAALKALQRANTKRKRIAQAIKVAQATAKPSQEPSQEPIKEKAA